MCALLFKLIIIVNILVLNVYDFSWLKACIVLKLLISSLYLHMLRNTKKILVDFRMFLFLFSSIFSRIEVENVSWLSRQFPISLVVIQHLLSAKI